MKITTDDWISLLIGIAVVVGCYLYLSDYDNKREQEMALFSQCVEDNNIDPVSTRTLDKVMTRMDAGNDLTEEELETIFSEEEQKTYNDDLNRYFLEVIEKCGVMDDG